MMQEHTERLILAKMVTEVPYMRHAINKLDEDCFKNESNRSVFSSAKRLFLDGDNLSLTHIAMNAGLMPVFITDLIKDSAKISNVEHYESRLVEFSKKIKVARIVQEARSIVSKESYEKTINFLSDAISKIEVGNVQTVRAINENVEETKQMIASRKNNKPYTSTGFKNLDMYLNGLQGGRLYCLSAMSGFGKSAMATNIAEHVSQKKPVYILSLEMDFEEVRDREIAQQTETTAYQLSRGNVDKFNAEKLANTKIFIDDSTDSSVEQAMCRIKATHLENNYGLIIIDYLQLLSTIESREADHLKVDHIVKKFKLLARELSLPIILIAQFNKQERGNTRPSMTSIKGSSSIYQHSDVVLILWSDLSQEEAQRREENNDKRVILSIEKNRCGKNNKDILLSFKSQYFKFEEV